VSVFLILKHHYVKVLFFPNILTKKDIYYSMKDFYFSSGFILCFVFFLKLPRYLHTRYDNEIALWMTMCTQHFKKS